MVSTITSQGRGVRGQSSSSPNTQRKVETIVPVLLCILDDGACVYCTASLLDLSVDVNPVNSSVSQRLKVQLLPIQVTYHAVRLGITVIHEVVSIISFQQETIDAAISMFKLSKDVHLQKYVVYQCLNFGV